MHLDKMQILKYTERKIITYKHYCVLSNSGLSNATSDWPKSDI